MPKIDRLKEIEKIADKLGIGQDRDVECVGCKKTFRFKDAVILSDGEEQKQLCKECYQKLLNGKLTEQNNDWLDHLRETIGDPDIRKREIQPVPYVPDEPPIRWDDQSTMPYRIGDYDISYTVSKDNNNLRENMFMAFVPKEYANKSS